MDHQPGRPITGVDDPDGEAPWAMQLVARVERAAPPTATAVCEAAGTAVARFLADERALPGGEWWPEVDRWLSGRIRKHARKARGAAWERACAWPGLTVAHGAAEVRAFVPGPTDAIPKDIGRLQLQGFDLDDPEPAAEIDPVPGGPLVVSITPHPALPTGKAAAAAGHAAQLAAARMPPSRLVAWAATGFAVAVEHPGPGRWRSLRHTSPVAVVDAGYTEVAPGTCTAVARWA